MAKHILAIMLLFFCGCHSVSAANLPVTSSFGWRVHPITGEWKFHSGVDLGYDYGTGIPALFDGLVMMAGDYGDGYGNQVVLYHTTLDTYSRFGHMSEVYVTVGSLVRQGEILGAVGSTGVSTGPHLHLEYIVRGINGYEYTDPLSLWE